MHVGRGATLIHSILWEIETLLPANGGRPVALVALACGWISLRRGCCVALTRSSLLLCRRYLSRLLPLFFVAMSVAVMFVTVNS